MRTSLAYRGIARSRFAFSILEMLIVISVMVILIALIAGAGVQVMEAQRERNTKNILTTLDRALEEYYAVQGVIPDFSIDPDDSARLERLYLDVPGMNPGGAFEQFVTFGMVDYPVRPDASVFLHQAEGFDTVREILEAIPPKFLLLTLEGGSYPSDAVEAAKEEPSLIDAWGRVVWNDVPVQGVQQFIYYVHPKNRVAQDLYGKCINGRPYFFSAGKDKFYGHPSEIDLIKGTYTDVDLADDAALLRRARKDNIYSYEGIDTAFEIRSDILSSL